ncbi:MAG: paraslipin, partial [Lentisphaeria bacterium]|nr:paraslipin [Lentisphaeria bacterium]
MEALITSLIIVALAIFLLVKTAKVVPQKEAWLVERLGKYHSTLTAGLHILIPFIDRIAYQQDLKEEAIDVPPQQCVTRDNITVEVDGLLYLQVIDPI